MDTSKSDEAAAGTSSEATAGEDPASAATPALRTYRELGEALHTLRVGFFSLHFFSLVLPCPGLLLNSFHSEINVQTSWKQPAWAVNVMDFV